MDWRCSDGIGGDDGLVVIDISIEPLNQISNMSTASDVASIQILTPE
jgi:hypothetical protein